MTAWSGLFDDEHGAPHVLQINRSSLRQKVAILLRQHGMSSDRELIDELNGVSLGRAALKNRFRVLAVAGTGGVDLGGSRTIETKEKLNRATAVADRTVWNGIIQEQASVAYVTDLSGNGGGGKLGV